MPDVLLLTDGGLLAVTGNDLMLFDQTALEECCCGGGGGCPESCVGCSDYYEFSIPAGTSWGLCYDGGTWSQRMKYTWGAGSFVSNIREDCYWTTNAVNYVAGELYVWLSNNTCSGLHDMVVDMGSLPHAVFIGCNTETGEWELVIDDGETFNIFTKDPSSCPNGTYSNGVDTATVSEYP